MGEFLQLLVLFSGGAFSLHCSALCPGNAPPGLLLSPLLALSGSPSPGRCCAVFPALLTAEGPWSSRALLHPIPAPCSRALLHPVLPADTRSGCLRCWQWGHEHSREHPLASSLHTESECHRCLRAHFGKCFVDVWALCSQCSLEQPPGPHLVPRCSCPRPGSVPCLISLL